VVFFEQAFEHLAAGGWADGVADTVVLGEGFHFVEAVVEIEVLPAIGIEDRYVECHVQAAEFDQGVAARGGGGRVLF